MHSSESKIKNSDLKKRSLLPLFIVISGILLSSLTAIFGADILPDYQDKLVHLRRIAALADTLKTGYFPARIYFVMNQGTGYAMPVFYPDIFMYIPAVLYMLGTPLSTAYDTYVILVNIVTALISYKCLKGFLEGDDLSAAVMSFVYTMSVYRLTDVYIRDAAGEYTAMAFLPLIIYGFYRIYALNDKAGADGAKAGAGTTPFSVWNVIRDAMPLGIGMAALMSSHILTTMMSAAFLAVTALILWKKTFRSFVLLRLLCSVLIFLLLSAYFLVPFMDYMMADEYLFSGSSDIMRGFYPGWRELLELIPAGSGSGIAYELRMPTQIGAALTAILASWFMRTLSMIFLAKKDPERIRLKDERILSGSLLFILTAVMLFISSKYFPWTYIESRGGLVSRLFCSVQFSWRYIGPSTVTAVFLGGLLLAGIRKKSRKYGSIFACLCLVLALVPALVLQQRACSENRRAFISRGEEIGIVSDELYFPVRWDREASYDGTPQAEGSVLIGSYDVSDHRWNLAVSNPGDDGTVLFPVVYYKGYAVTDAEGKALDTFMGDDGRACVRIPSGYEGSIMMEYKVPGYWRLAEVVSIISLLAACILGNGRTRTAGGNKDKNTDHGSE
ncbi:MAG: hypothetical protein K6G43_05150 [Lachnospiraceae bacterium]|nr:hypothetical protein [Lachnospiraceae bacterium]